MYDAIVVGARCAGAPTAMLLARKGYRVLLVDRVSFPSDTLSVHYLHQPGVARLRRWGLLEQIIASGCPPVRQQVLDLGPFALSGAPPPIDGVAEAYAPRRTVLDKILVDAAVAAGAELRETFTVTELLRDNEGVIGVRGHARGRTPVEERARIVIGADGMHSTVARHVGAATYHDRPSFTCAYYAYWSDVPLAGAELHPRPERMLIAGPTNDAQILLICYWPSTMFHQVRSDIEGHFMQALQLVPDLYERVRAGTRSERFRGTGDLPNFYRRPYGPGWALVGDAGYHKDPVTAQGMSDAFRDAELLAGALDDGFAGRQSLDVAMAEYEQQRNAATLPTYELTSQFAALAPPSAEQQLLFGALRHNQEQTNRLFGAIVGTVPIPEFLAPENLGRIIGAAPSAVPAAAD